MIGVEHEVPFFSVEFALNVEGRGLLVLCKFPDPPRVQVKVGDLLEFLRPDGTFLRTTVRALGIVMDAQPGLLGLYLPLEIAKDDIPYGSRVRIAQAKD